MRTPDTTARPRWRRSSHLHSVKPFLHHTFAQIEPHGGEGSLKRKLVHTEAADSMLQWLFRKGNETNTISCFKKVHELKRCSPFMRQWDSRSDCP